jgi:cellobiose phosphorylase
MMDAAWLPPFGSIDDPAPHGRLLSNGRYVALLTSAGTGVSALRDVQLTAWDGDRVQDDCGWFLYLRDGDSGRVWSAAPRPVCDPSAMYRAAYAPGVVTLESTVDDVTAVLDVCVAPDVDCEVRRLTVTNRAPRARRIQVISYCEVVLNHAAAHAGHPAFSKLFVETAYDAERQVLLARRRPRSRGEGAPAMALTLLGADGIEIETSRAAFLGRNRGPDAPAALAGAARLQGSVGSVLDPVFAVRGEVVLAAGASATIHVLLAAAADEDAARAALVRAAEPAFLADVCAAAARRERELVAHHALDDADAQAYQELAVAVRYGHPALRGAPSVLRRAQGALNDIWQFGLGDAPFVLVQVDDPTDLPRIDAVVAAQAYWLSEATRIDVMILCAVAVTDAALEALARRAPSGAVLAVRRASALPAATIDVLHAAAAWVCAGPPPDLRAAQGPARSAGGSDHGRPDAAPQTAAIHPSLQVDNGTGGFSEDGSEYVIRVDGSNGPPLAWTNVIANERVGFLVSERGAAFTWSRNSHEHRLTPWSNDPVRDPHGEALYLRDDDSGACWSPQPGPMRAAAAFEVRHGFGVSRWRHRSHELEHDVIAFVARREPLRVVRVRVTNTGRTARRLSLFSYQRLVIGVTPADSGRFVVTAHDPDRQVLFAENRVNGELNGAVVFAAIACAAPGARVGYGGDRAAFLGRNGSPAAPAALGAGGMLEGPVGAGLDPCLVLQLACELPPGGTVDCAFLLGDADGRGAAAELVERYRAPGAIEAALAEVTAYWRETLGAVRVETPEPAIDLMVNGWLLYQSMSCRLWGRSALYQSGGAFGFRDQLQDSAALVYAHPELTRAQILLHAAHQFVEGDVLHWWHPPASRGTRTRFSDDLLWLPYIAEFYAHTTGDWRVFDERADFMTAPALAAGQDEAYLLPQPAGAPATVYDHCCRAVDRSLTRGVHGLPLMGTGDWNDGMNRVGREGRGESVWVGFFLFDLLGRFIPLCERRGDATRARRYAEFRRALQEALNTAGWDGAWYRRAYYDDGAPLGSATSVDCQIDALAQSWSVISGAASSERGAQAMGAVERLLVDRHAQLIKLLAPPFDRGPHDPGYIKGYVPGIRENGGQYTHAATWTVRACAELGWRDRAAGYLAMLSPVAHSRTAADVARYQVEPYVVAADVYGIAPHVGRGGWTWYTGSAAWMYRVALESVLGITIVGGRELCIRPCVPDEWPGFRVQVRCPSVGGRYDVRVENPDGCAAAVRIATCDGAAVAVDAAGAHVPIAGDGSTHTVHVILGRSR